MRQFRRTASVIAGVFTLVQAILYSVFTIYCCAIYTCLTEFPFDVDTNSVADLAYLAYFKGKCRISAGGPQVEAPSANRTYYIMIAYGIASAIWIPTSTLLVVAAISRVKGRNGALLFYPWIFNALVLILMDIAGGVWYALDVLNTVNPNDFKSFIGAGVGPLPNNFDGLTTVPSWIMFGIFTRGLLIWLINLIFFVVVIQATSDVKKDFSTSEFIRGSTPKRLQNVTEPNLSRKSSSRWVNAREEIILPRLDPTNPPPHALTLEINDRVPSPHTPLEGDAPSPFIRKRGSFKRSQSSPVFNVLGTPTGETFPFPQDPNRRYNVNNARARFQDLEAIELERDREMEEQRELERERMAELARYRDNERERKELEYQRMRDASETTEDTDGLNNQRPWQYVRPTDLNLKPKYDQTLKLKSGFGAVSQPKIPMPDYDDAPRIRWNPENLSRNPSNAGDRKRNDQRLNAKAAY